MNQKNLSSLTFIAIQAALHAGEEIKKGFNTSYEVQEKEGKQNLVTTYDHLSEEIILSKIKKHFPSHGFIAEESGIKESKDSEFLWVIDPLDGTVNFAHHIPIFTVSIAAYQNHEILCGVVYQPMTAELFIAERGQGAYLNGKPLKVSEKKNLDSSLLATGFPYNINENPEHCLDIFYQIAKQGYPIRRLGSAALDLSYVAAGRFEVFWEAILQPWDFGAGMLLVQEAGGKVSDWNGKEKNFKEPGPLLATNGHLHSLILQKLHA